MRRHLRKIFRRARRSGIFQHGMACPLCGDECTCSYAGSSVSFAPRTRAKYVSSTSTHSRHLVDPDAYDASEERFAASLVTCDPPSMPIPVTTSAEPPIVNLADNKTMDDDTQTGIEKRMFEENQSQQESESWRDEIASRVHSYRRRRGKRIVGQYSMDLEFETSHGQGGHGATAAAPVLREDPARTRVPRAFRNLVLSEEPVMASTQPAMSNAAAAPAVEPVEPEPALPDPAPEQQSLATPQPEPQPEPAPLRRRRSHTEPKIIEFPRSANYSMFPSPDELAEPVVDLPRILDVPETVPAPEPSMLAGIQLEEPEAEPLLESQIEVPPQVAPVPVRVSAALVDWLVVLVASGIFAFIAHYLCGDVPLTKPVLAFALVVPCFFWALYEYLFLVHGGRTPGMQTVQLELRSFDGSPVHRHTRQLRALMMVMSCISVGMGFLSAMLDDDTLCWHDRVTRTYVGRK